MSCPAANMFIKTRTWRSFTLAGATVRIRFACQLHLHFYFLLFSQSNLISPHLKMSVAQVTRFTVKAQRNATARLCFWVFFPLLPANVGRVGRSLDADQFEDTPFVIRVCLRKFGGWQPAP